MPDRDHRDVLEKFDRIVDLIDPRHGPVSSTLFASFRPYHPLVRYPNDEAGAISTLGDTRSTSVKRGISSTPVKTSESALNLRPSRLSELFFHQSTSRLIHHFVRFSLSHSSPKGIYVCSSIAFAIIFTPWSSRFKGSTNL